MSWTGIDDLFAGYEKMMTHADMAAKQIIAESGALVIALAQRNFEGVHKRGKPHVGGEKPNIVTGYLRRSIRMNPIVKIGRGSYVSQVGPNAVYGRSVELGRNGSTGHPYFTPAVHSAEQAFGLIRDRAFAQHLR